MRKLAPFALGLFLFAAPLSAQAGFGLVGGFVNASISESNGSSTFMPSSRSGFAAGISLTGNAGPNAEFGPEVLYIEKGFKVTDGTITGIARLKYIEVPVLLRLMLGNGPSKAFLLVGPSIAFKTSCSTDADNGTTSISADCGSGDDDIINAKSTDFSLMFGGGVIVRQLAITVRYDLGLTNIDGNSDNVSVKNHALLILAGLHLGR